MVEFTEGVLPVPGATLYHKLQGNGPLLLILQGGAGDADGLNTMVENLTGRFTVVTYDRRGLSRSKLDERAEAPNVVTHSEDVSHLITALSDGPVLIFGGSIGAFIGLELLSRHPDQVKLLVAHEPPATQFLPEPERSRASQSQADVEETFRREGAGVAVRQFLTITGIDFSDREPDMRLSGPTPNLASNNEFFLTYDAPAVRTHTLNASVIQGSAEKIVAAAGETSKEFWIHHCATALADYLHKEVVEFPGGHNGYLLRPRAFAKRLIEVLDEGPGEDRAN